MIDYLLDWSWIYWLTNWLIDRSIGWWIEWVIDWLVDRLIERVIDWWIEWFIDWWNASLIDQMIYYLLDWSWIDRLIDWSTAWSIRLIHWRLIDWQHLDNGRGCRTWSCSSHRQPRMWISLFVVIHALQTSFKEYQHAFCASVANM